MQKELEIKPNKEIKTKYNTLSDIINNIIYNI